MPYYQYVRSVIPPGPPSKKPASRGTLWQPGTPTADGRRGITDDGHRTIPTAATSFISPALDRLSCALRMARRKDEQVLTIIEAPASTQAAFMVHSLAFRR